MNTFFASPVVVHVFIPDRTTGRSTTKRKRRWRGRQFLSTLFTDDLLAYIRRYIDDILE